MPPTDQKAQQAITTYVSDMLAIAKHVATPVDAQSKDEAAKMTPETSTLFPRIKQIIDRQVERLDTHLEQLGGHPAGGLKNAVSSIMGSAAATIDKSRKMRVSKMVRDDQTALALMTVSYTMLHATALGLRDQQTADLAQRSLEELTPLVMELNRCIPAIVIAELKEDGLEVDADAVEKSRDTTQRAWN